MTIAAVRRVELRGAARQLLSCRDGEIVLSGPAGTGKSVGGLTKQHLAAMKYPGSRHLLLRKTAASLGASTLEVYRKHVAVASLACGDVEYYGGSTSEPAQYRYKRNGSSIVIGGMDKPSKIMSSAYDTAVMDEGTEFFVDDFEAVVSRMRAGNMPYSQIMMMCNPDSEYHWIYQRAQAGGMTMLESRHEDNPAYFDAFGQITPAGAAYLGKLDRLTGVRYLRLRKGLWVAAEGLIYEDWDPADHLVDALPEGSESWVRWWSIDFGYRNPTVIQCWAEDGDGRLWLYREVVHTGRLVEDHVRTIMGIVRPGGVWIEPRPRGIIADHDAEDRATFERHAGMRTLPAIKTVRPGIEALQARLRKAGDGRARVFVVRGCVVERDPDMIDAKTPIGMTEEVSGYVWATGPDGRAAKEEPLKVNDHSMDAARYICAQLDLGGRPGMRVLGR
jgi:PBSX family phage terminase large subunit